MKPALAVITDALALMAPLITDRSLSKTQRSTLLRGWDALDELREELAAPKAPPAKPTK